MKITLKQGKRIMNDELYFLNVIVIKKSVIDVSYLFVGPLKEIAKQAEKKFLDLCADNISNWDEHTLEDIEDILDDGYYEFGNGNSICITHPSVERVNCD